jgi:hypothetical protein
MGPSRKRLSRRALLRGAGGVMVAMPAMEAMLPRTARAQAAARPKRLVIFFTPNGTDNHFPNSNHFVPKTPGTTYVLGPEVAPLEPLRRKLLILSGVHMDSCKPAINGIGDLHSVGMSQMLTGIKYIEDMQYIKYNNRAAGFAGGISVDQHLAKRIGNATRFPSLEFGVCTTSDYGIHPFSRMISAGPNQPVPPEDDPASLFKRVFTDGSVMADSGMDKIRTQRLSILDFVKDDFMRLQPRLSAGDRRKLDQHLTAVRDLETRLARPVPAPSSNLACMNPTFAQAGDPLSKANFPTTGKQQMDLLALALKCDVTRIASLQWSWARSTLVHTWTGSNKSHHDMSHFGPTPELTAVNTWFSSQLAYFAQQLDAADEGNGTSVLDNSIIWYCSEVNWGYTHSFDDIRVFLLGTGGGAIKTGQYMALNSQPHQKLLVTLMNAMGVNENQFGDASYGTGPLPGVLA